MWKGAERSAAQRGRGLPGRTTAERLDEAGMGTSSRAPAASRKHCPCWEIKARRDSNLRVSRLPKKIRRSVADRSAQALLPRSGWSDSWFVSVPLIVNQSVTWPEVLVVVDPITPSF
ncbi:hypothetical protein GN956_G671 [Arapaima gigas]